MGLFSPNLKENEFCWSKGLCQFLNIPVIYDGAKNYKQLTTHSWVNRRTDGQTDRQQGYYGTLCGAGVHKIKFGKVQPSLRRKNIHKPDPFIKTMVHRSNTHYSEIY